MMLNDVIRTRRQALGLTQEGLAERLGVSAPAAVSYTHLDVYKRQRRSRGFWRRSSGPTPSTLRPGRTSPQRSCSPPDGTR